MRRRVRPDVFASFLQPLLNTFCFFFLQSNTGIILCLQFHQSFSLNHWKTVTAFIESCCNQPQTYAKADICAHWCSSFLGLYRRRQVWWGDLLARHYKLKNVSACSSVCWWRYFGCSLKFLLAFYTSAFSGCVSQHEIAMAEDMSKTDTILTIQLSIIIILQLYYCHVTKSGFDIVLLGISILTICLINHNDALSYS